MIEQPTMTVSQLLAGYRDEHAPRLGCDRRPCALCVELARHIAHAKTRRQAGTEAAPTGTVVLVCVVCRVQREGLDAQGQCPGCRQRWRELQAATNGASS